MRKFFLFFVCCFLMLSVFAQNADLLQTDLDFLYVTTHVASKAEVNALSHRFSVDNCHFDERSGQYDVRIYLARHEYSDFMAQHLPFEILTPERPPGGSMVSTSLSDFTANWNKYPAYDVYEELMHSFETNFPDICKIDTILAATPNPQRPHKILAAHISSTLGQPADKPAFLYSSTMHGDEVVGYYMMLQLINYILNNATADTQVQNILQNVDLYICPLENPDGTYKNSNTQISSYYSTRYNYNNVDLNRNYPFVPGISGSANVQPETQAIINWVADKHFVMSVNFHGGAELTNYPWDSWETADRAHPDANWYRYICQNYVDDCQEIDPSYMVGETAYQPGCGAVTEGGDWYVIDGSRQDYMNYYQHCREITIEAHFDKVVTSSSSLPTYWTNSKNALLNYIEECLYGFRGVVTDAVTGEPVEAKIFVQNHDTFNSEVYSHLPVGNYHRPIKAGTYTVEVSADCYETQTFTVTTTDGAGVRHDVQLQPLVSAPQVADQHINAGETATLTATSSHTINWYDSETASTPLATGTTFTTPALSQNTTYFVEEMAVVNNLTCVSERVSATVFVEGAAPDTTIENPDTIPTDPDTIVVVPDPVYTDVSFEACDAFVYEGTNYLQSGDYEIVYANAAANGADSILRLHLTLHSSYSENRILNVALWDTYQIEDDTYTATAPGMFTYDKIHQTVFGCDSVIHYFVYVTSPTEVYADTSITACSPFIYEGEVLIMSGDYTFVYPGASASGVDSILMIHLTLHPSYEQDLLIPLSLGESYWMGDEEFVAMQAGSYDFNKQFTTQFGCDSIVHYHFAIENTGIDELTVNQLFIYPNPTQSQVWISRIGQCSFATISLYDAMGKCLLSREWTDEKMMLDLTELPSGIYFVQVLEQGNLRQQKVIKQ